MSSSFPFCRRIADLLRFCYDQLSLSQDELIRKYPDLSTGAELVDLQRIIEMYHRHADQVVSTFSTLGNASLQTDFSTLLIKS